MLLFTVRGVTGSLHIAAAHAAAWRDAEQPGGGQRGAAQDGSPLPVDRSGLLQLLRDAKAAGDAVLVKHYDYYDS